VSDDADTGHPRPDPQLPAELPRASWGREGYAASEVDAFLARLQPALLREPPAMAPYEVEDQRFTVKRFGRRYALRPVDEYLDQAQSTLRERHGDDAVAHVHGTAPEPHKVHTGWIYLVALVLVAAMVAFLVTQL
jgi:hypothetical protein